MKRNVILFLSFTVMILCVYNISSAMGNKLMVKGNVLNKSDKSPLDVSLTFKGPNGKEIKTKSIDGKYEILLDANVEYDVFINSKNTIRYQTEYKHKSQDSYTELNHDFCINKIEAGAVIDNIESSFNQNKLTEAAISKLDNIKKILRFNRTVYLTFYVISDNSANAQTMISNLNEYLEDWNKFSNKIENVESVDKYKDVSANNGDILVVISSIKDPFGR